MQRFFFLGWFCFFGGFLCGGAWCFVVVWGVAWCCVMLCSVVWCIVVFCGGVVVFCSVVVCDVV